MLHITPHQGNINQNRNEVPPHTSQNGNHSGNRCWQACRESGTLLHYWWECKLVQLLWKTVWKFLKKLKIKLPYDPATALLGIYLKDTKIVIQKGTCTPMFIAAVSTTAKLWKEPRCLSTGEWIKKMWYIYIGILLSPQKMQSCHLQRHGWN